MNISLLEPIGVPEEMIESLAEGLKKTRARVYLL